jgi:hypothetical protein
LLRICAPAELAPLAVFPAAAPSAEQEQGGNGNGLFAGEWQTLYVSSIFFPFFAGMILNVLRSRPQSSCHPSVRQLSAAFFLYRPVVLFLAAINSPG